MKKKGEWQQTDVNEERGEGRRWRNKGSKEKEGNNVKKGGSGRGK